MLLAGAAAGAPLRIQDPFWNFTYRAPGLRSLLTPGQAARLFKGRANDLFIEITVHESERVEDAAAWRATRLRELKSKAPTVGDDPVPHLFWTERKYGAYDEQHGYGFFARGFHCFEVHAWIPDKTPSSKKEILAALAGMKLGPDKGCGVQVRSVALLHGREPTDPEVLLEAGRVYLEKHPALAVSVLGRLRRELKPKALDPGDEAKLFQYGGMAALGTKQYTEATGWLREAEKRAKPESAPAMAYQLARAASAAADLDTAFKALDRAFRENLVVSKARLSKEKELENARKDPRWETFWRAHIEGK